MNRIIRAQTHQKALTKALQDYEHYRELNVKLGQSVPEIGVELFTGQSCYHTLRFPAHFSRNAIHEIIENLPFLRTHTKGFALWQFVIEHGVTSIVESEPVIDDDGEILGYAVSKTRYRWTETVKKWNEVAPDAWQYKGKDPAAQIQMEFQRANAAMHRGESVTGLKRALHRPQLVVHTKRHERQNG